MCFRYADKVPHMKETADFDEYISNFWKIVNVKNPRVGIHKRDIYREPIRSKNCPQLEYLREFYSFLEEWASNKSYKGISSQTFNAAKHTTQALIGVAEYCMEHLRFEYVLLGKLQSDPIERRFGQYRQMSGGNFLISVRQLKGNSVCPFLADFITVRIRVHSTKWLLMKFRFVYNPIKIWNQNFLNSVFTAGKAIYYS